MLTKYRLSRSVSLPLSTVSKREMGFSEIMQSITQTGA
ncbi:alpha-amylase/4-alpha-glucanotransferase domain-containing protein [Pseudomonas sp. AMR01]